MHETTILLTLATVHLIALMSPGPDFALVVQSATRHGRKTGLYIALGLSVGIFIQSLLSITGVSYVVHQHPTMFAVLQFLGGSYLFYLGVGALTSVIATKGSNTPDISATRREPALLHNKRQAFSRGFATNILNPKALVFFVSLMSTLVPASMSISGKGFAVLIVWSLSLLWFSLLAWLLSTERLQKRLQSLGSYIDGLCGLLFLAIGGYIFYQSLSPWFHSLAT